MNPIQQSDERLTRNAIPLDDPDAVIEATQGFIDVFAVASGEVGAAGTLHHLMRAGVNQPIIGAVAPPHGVQRLLAVPGPGTSVETATRESWLAAREDEALAEVIEKLTDAVWEWSAARPLDHSPDDPKRLIPGERCNAAAGEQLACDYGMVAFEVVSGKLRFLGAEAAEFGAGARGFVTRHAWLAAAEDAEVDVRAVDELEDVAGAVQSYEAFQHAYMLAECAALCEHERAGTERLRRRVRNIEAGLDEGMLKMQRLLEPKTAATIDSVSRHAALLGAARQVGEYQGIAFVDIGDGPAGVSAYVQAMADSSGVRVRSVTLSGEWWRRDSGPLLAFQAGNETPLALLPGRGRRYFMREFSSGAEVRVDGAVAAGLKPYAFAFYRPFPYEPIGVVGMVRFGLAGLGRDMGPILGLAAFIALLGMLAPIATAEIVDRVIPSAQTSMLVQLGLVLVAVAVIQTLFTLARSLLLLRVQDRMEHNIQAAVWDRVLGLPIDFFRDYAVGDLTMRVNAINMIHRMLSVQTLVTLLNGAFALLNFAVLLKFSAGLALLAVVIVAGALGSLYALGVMTMKALDATVASTRKIMSLVLQLVQGVAKLRTTASEARAFGLWAGEFALFRAVRYKIIKLQTQQKTYFAAYQHLGLVLVFVTMAILLTRPGGSGLTAGEFVGFFAAFTVLFMGVIGICDTVVGLYLVAPLYKMTKPLLESLPETGAGKTDPGRISGKIEVSQLSFGYPDGDLVLDDVAFTIPAGSFTAVVGPSGSGKSTLLRVLLGFDAPDGGAILFDDKNLKDLDQRVLRRQFGVVLQGSPLMAGDIFSNIVGVSVGTIDDAWEAARQAGLEEDIQAMPMGMHTAIGEGTSTLSGGQRQRILIARSLVGRPRILFLDEATSALDNRSQAVVSASLLRLKATRVVIAHRLSTIAQADQIIVLDGGRVVQQGTYDELLEQEGLFAELARRQSLEEPQQVEE